MSHVSPRPVLRVLSVALLVALVAAQLPAPAAADPPARYLTGANVGLLGQGPPRVGICATGCDLDGDGADDVCCVGAVALTLPSVLTAVVATDAVWGHEVGWSFCLLDAADRPDCGPGTAVGPVCGPVLLEVDPWTPGSRVVAFLVTLLVTPDLGVCGATRGVVAAT